MPKFKISPPRKSPYPKIQVCKEAPGGLFEDLGLQNKAFDCPKWLHRQGFAPQVHFLQLRVLTCSSYPLFQTTKGNYKLFEIAYVWDNGQSRLWSVLYCSKMSVRFSRFFRILYVTFVFFYNFCDFLWLFTQGAFRVKLTPDVRQQLHRCTPKLKDSVHLRCKDQKEPCIEVYTLLTYIWCLCK